MVFCWGLRLREAEATAAAGKLSPEDVNFLRLFLRCFFFMGYQHGGSDGMVDYMYTVRHVPTICCSIFCVAHHRA